MDSPPRNSDRRPLRERLARHMTRRKPASSASSSPASASAAPGPDDDHKPADSAHPDTTFDCNVCFDVPRDPVVTPCGHLYCWPCLYTWMCLNEDSPQCPVCKAGISKRTVIPLYGRGRSQTHDPRERPLPPDAEVPPRPSGRRDTPNRRRFNPNAPFGVHHTFGINAHPGNYELSFSHFGIFPTIFGLHIAYPHANDPPTDQAREQHEENLPELVSKIFLMLAIFIIIIILLF